MSPRFRPSLFALGTRLDYPEVSLFIAPTRGRMASKLQPEIAKMRANGKDLTSIVLRTAVVLLCGLAGSTAAAAQQPGSELPDFIDFESGERRTIHHYPDKILVLNFWATWCVPCLEEMPLLVSIQERYSEQGIQVVGISADREETQDRIKPFLEKFKINFPIWLGGTTEHMLRLELGGALPATAILDGRGRIVGRITGKATESDLTDYIEWLLKAPPGSVDRLSEAEDHDHEEHHEDSNEDHAHAEIGPEGASRVPS